MRASDEQEETRWESNRTEYPLLKIRGSRNGQPIGNRESQHSQGREGSANPNHKSFKLPDATSNKEQADFRQSALTVVCAAANVSRLPTTEDRPDLSNKQGKSGILKRSTVHPVLDYDAAKPDVRVPRNEGNISNTSTSVTSAGQAPSDEPPVSSDCVATTTTPPVATSPDEGNLAVVSANVDVGTECPTLSPVNPIANSGERCNQSADHIDPEISADTTNLMDEQKLYGDFIFPYILRKLYIRKIFGSGTKTTGESTDGTTKPCSPNIDSIAEIDELYLNALKTFPEENKLSTNKQLDGIMNLIRTKMSAKLNGTRRVTSRENRPIGDDGSDRGTRDSTTHVPSASRKRQASAIDAQSGKPDSLGASDKTCNDEPSYGKIMVLDRKSLGHNVRELIHENAKVPITENGILRIPMHSCEGTVSIPSTGIAHVPITAQQSDNSRPDVTSVISSSLWCTTAETSHPFVSYPSSVHTTCVPPAINDVSNVSNTAEGNYATGIIDLTIALLRDERRYNARMFRAKNTPTRNPDQYNDSLSFEDSSFLKPFHFLIVIIQVFKYSKSADIPLLFQRINAASPGEKFTAPDLYRCLKRVHKFIDKLMSGVYDNINTPLGSVIKQIYRQLNYVHQGSIHQHNNAQLNYVYERSVPQERNPQVNYVHEGTVPQQNNAKVSYTHQGSELHQPSAPVNYVHQGTVPKQQNAQVRYVHRGTIPQQKNAQIQYAQQGSVPQQPNAQDDCAQGSVPTQSSAQVNYLPRRCVPQQTSAQVNYTHGGSETHQSNSQVSYVHQGSVLQRTNHAQPGHVPQQTNAQVNYTNQGSVPQQTNVEVNHAHQGTLTQQTNIQYVFSSQQFDNQRSNLRCNPPHLGSSPFNNHNIPETCIQSDLAPVAGFSSATIPSTTCMPTSSSQDVSSKQRSCLNRNPLLNAILAKPVNLPIGSSEKSSSSEVRPPPPPYTKPIVYSHQLSSNANNNSSHMIRNVMSKTLTNGEDARDLYNRSLEEQQSLRTDSSPRSFIRAYEMRILLRRMVSQKTALKNQELCKLLVKRGGSVQTIPGNKPHVLAMSGDQRYVPVVQTSSFSQNKSPVVINATPSDQTAVTQPTPSNKPRALVQATSGTNDDPHVIQDDQTFTSVAQATPRNRLRTSTFQAAAGYHPHVSVLQASSEVHPLASVGQTNSRNHLQISSPQTVSLYQPLASGVEDSSEDHTVVSADKGTPRNRLQTSSVQSASGYDPHSCVMQTPPENYIHVYLEPSSPGNQLQTSSVQAASVYQRHASVVNTSSEYDPHISLVQANFINLEDNEEGEGSSGNQTSAAVHLMKIAAAVSGAAPPESQPPTNNMEIVDSDAEISDISIVYEGVPLKRCVSRDSGYRTPSPNKEHLPSDGIKELVQEMRMCARCDRVATVTCSLCQTVFYCSEQCHVQQWDDVHHSVCTGVFHEES